MTQIISNIEVLREKLNQMMYDEKDPGKIYMISTELDHWIVKYYNQE